MLFRIPGSISVKHDVKTWKAVQYTVQCGDYESCAVHGAMRGLRKLCNTQCNVRKCVALSISCNGFLSLENVAVLKVTLKSKRFDLLRDGG